jgi:hypothetical protein
MMGSSTLLAIGRAGAAESSTTIGGTANVAIIAITIATVTATSMTADRHSMRIRRARP